MIQSLWKEIQMKSILAGLLALAIAGTAFTAGAAPARGAEQRIAIRVTNKGFEPATVKVKAGQPVVLVVTRTTDKTCAKEIVIKEQKVHRPLPLDRAVEIRFTPKKPGTFRYACGMDMLSGKVVVQ